MFQEMFAGLSDVISPWVFFSIVYALLLTAIMAIPSRKSIRLGEVEHYSILRQGYVIGAALVAIIVGALLAGVMAEGGKGSSVYVATNSIMLLLMGSGMAFENFWKYRMINEKVRAGEVVHVGAQVTGDTMTNHPPTGPVLSAIHGIARGEGSGRQAEEPVEAVARPVQQLPRPQEPIHGGEKHLVELVQCPKCKKTFEHEIEKKPFKLICPGCGAQGIIR